jgi:hypothetical protein
MCSPDMEAVGAANACTDTDLYTLIYPTAQMPMFYGI